MGKRLIAGAVSALLSMGCGDSTPTAPSTQVRAEDVSLVANPDGRVVVATVNDQPVYADCVERQGAAHGLDVRAALDECIDFELLAQQADRAGHRVDPEVLEVRDREAVRAFIDHEFVANFDGPEDVPMEHVRSYYDEVKEQKYVRPEERRETQYARVAVASGIPEGSDEDLEAKEIADAIYAAMKHRTDLTEEEFILEARKIAAPTAISKESSAFNFPKVSRILPVYAEATWRIPKPGRIHPPIRTPYGWDVILLTQILPPLHISIEDATAEIREIIYEVSRARSFAAWVGGLGGSKPVVDQSALERLALQQQAREHLLTPSPAPATNETP
ncbi:MAG TPA: hypothetical protein VML75_15435 [Kofleriaceae bacterium]|nr:hypothetical protein [Kofleriaceae bacterium]